MKRTLIIIGSVGLVIFLIVRMIIVQSNREDESRRVFVSKLDYDFSTVVDSVGLFAPQVPVGLIYFKAGDTTLGNQEKKISRRLTKKRRYRFLVQRRSGYEVFSKDAREFKIGDSIYINTSEDRMRLVREGKLIREFVISETIRVDD